MTYNQRFSTRNFRYTIQHCLLQLQRVFWSQLYKNYTSLSQSQSSRAIEGSHDATRRRDTSMLAGSLKGNTEKFAAVETVKYHCPVPKSKLNRATKLECAQLWNPKLGKQSRRKSKAMLLALKLQQGFV